MPGDFWNEMFAWGARRRNTLLFAILRVVDADAAFRVHATVDSLAEKFAVQYRISVSYVAATAYSFCFLQCAVIWLSQLVGYCSACFPACTGS